MYLCLFNMTLSDTTLCCYLPYVTLKTYMVRFELSQQCS